MERVDATTELGKILVWSSQQKATDLHTQADRRYSIRLDGKLQRIVPEQFPVPSNDDVIQPSSLYPEARPTRQTPGIDFG